MLYAAFVSFGAGIVAGTVIGAAITRVLHLRPELGTAKRELDDGHTHIWSPWEDAEPGYQVRECVACNQKQKSLIETLRRDI
jgi:hypothetical protein